MGFLGIRRRRDYDADIAGNKPGHVIATGLLMATVLVTLLVAVRPLGGARGAVKSGGQPVRDPALQAQAGTGACRHCARTSAARSYAYRPHDLITRMT
ncbi:DUF2970 domain-containing protein [Achromobacter xylosoxidans]